MVPGLYARRLPQGFADPRSMRAANRTSSSPRSRSRAGVGPFGHDETPRSQLVEQTRDVASDRRAISVVLGGDDVDDLPLVAAFGEQLPHARADFVQTEVRTG